VADVPGAVADTHALLFHASDALIVAAARTLALPLVTRDRDIRASGAVRLFW
jgi:hypothetical protein